MDTQKFKTALLERKKNLQAHSEQSKSARAPVELDQTLQGRLSRQDAMMQQEMAKATEQKRQDEIIRINAALTRIENGEFGYCVKCGENIAQARLDNDPAVPACINCAK